MRTNFKATGLVLTPDLTQYAEKRLAALHKYLSDSPDAVIQVEMGKSTQHHKTGDVFRAEIHIIGQGVDVYASAEEGDIRTALDRVKDDMAHKLTHEKGRREALYRRGARRVKEMLKGLNFFKKRP